MLTLILGEYLNFEEEANEMCVTACVGYSQMFNGFWVYYMSTLTFHKTYRDMH